MVNNENMEFSRRKECRLGSYVAAAIESLATFKLNNENKVGAADVLKNMLEAKMFSLGEIRSYNAAISNILLDPNRKKRISYILNNHLSNRPGPIDLLSNEILFPPDCSNVKDENLFYGNGKPNSSSSKTQKKKFLFHCFDPKHPPTTVGSNNTKRDNKNGNYRKLMEQQKIYLNYEVARKNSIHWRLQDEQTLKERPKLLQSNSKEDYKIDITGINNQYNKKLTFCDKGPNNYKHENHATTNSNVKSDFVSVDSAIECFLDDIRNGPIKFDNSSVLCEESHMYHELNNRGRCIALKPIPKQNDYSKEMNINNYVTVKEFYDESTMKNCNDDPNYFYKGSNFVSENAYTDSQFYCSTICDQDAYLSSGNQIGNYDDFTPFKSSKKKYLRKKENFKNEHDDIDGQFLNQQHSYNNSPCYAQGNYGVLASRNNSDFGHVVQPNKECHSNFYSQEDAEISIAQNNTAIQFGNRPNNNDNPHWYSQRNQYVLPTHGGTNVQSEQLSHNYNHGDYSTAGNKKIFIEQGNNFTQCSAQSHNYHHPHYSSTSNKDVFTGYANSVTQFAAQSINYNQSSFSTAKNVDVLVGHGNIDVQFSDNLNNYNQQYCSTGIQEGLLDDNVSNDMQLNYLYKNYNFSEVISQANTSIEENCNFPVQFTTPTYNYRDSSGNESFINNGFQLEKNKCNNFYAENNVHGVFNSATAENGNFYDESNQNFSATDGGFIVQSKNLGNCYLRGNQLFTNRNNEIIDSQYSAPIINSIDYCSEPLNHINNTFGKNNTVSQYAPNANNYNDVFIYAQKNNNSSRFRTSSINKSEYHHPLVKNGSSVKEKDSEINVGTSRSILNNDIFDSFSFKSDSRSIENQDDMLCSYGKIIDSCYLHDSSSRLQDSSFLHQLDLTDLSEYTADEDGSSNKPLNSTENYNVEERCATQDIHNIVAFYELLTELARSGRG